MKKFLSLLLALTMVLSLVVVPARADDTLAANPATVELTRGGEGQSVTVSGAPEGATYTWTSTDTAIATVSGSGIAATISPAAAGETTVTCRATKAAVEAGEGEEEGQPAFDEMVTITVTVADAFLASDVTAVSFNGRSYAVTSGSASVVKLASEDFAAEGAWSATIGSSTGYTYKSCTYADDKLTVTAQKTGCADATVEITINPVEASVSASAEPATVISGGKTTLTATPTNLSASATYKWYTVDGETKTVFATGKSCTWTAPAVEAETTCTVYCDAYEGEALAATSEAVSVTVKVDVYKAVAKDGETSKVIDANGKDGDAIQKTWQIAKPYLVNKSDSNDTVTEGLTYKFVSSNTKVATVGETTGLVTAGSTSGTAKITATITYLGKDYTLEYTVINSSLSTSLGSVENGDYDSFTASELKNAAKTMLKNAEIEGTVESVTLTAGDIKVNGKKVASLKANTGSSGGYTLTTVAGAVTTVPIEGTVKTTDGKSYTATFTVTITPIEASFTDQYPLPESYNNGKAYRYAVEVPSGYTSFYVVAKNAKNEPSDWSTAIGNKTYTGKSNSILYLTDDDFKDGKCVLYIVAFKSTDYAYCGSLTVYQENYDIEYTGVAGETVKFSKDDFTTFLNNVADNTTSSWYVFDHVKFANFNAKAQGVLYYGTNAMGTSSSSKFKSSTKITDLDSMSFAIADKTTAKQIVVNFTLYADQYRTVSGKDKKVNDDVAFTGRVVIDVVREDIKLTVAPGSSITLDAADFQTYLNSNKTYSKSTVDYVTFNTEEMSPLYLGLLYTYSSSSYYFGNNVKTTDKFYYSPTRNQNAISDVKFQAATTALASLGSTVYIPFTIKVAKSNALVEGTLAIEIVQPVSFSDVKAGEYYYNAVQWAVNEGITKGTSTTTFSPDMSCTRAQIVTFLWRAAGSPTPSKTTTAFKDVTAAHKDYATAIAWASEKGITTGTSATTFSPDASCTRAQIVTFLYRYAGKPATSGTLSFSDVSKTTHADYYSAILWATRNGITSGITTTTFAPDTTCTRGHAVTFLYRYMGQ